MNSLCLQVLLTLGSSYELVENLHDGHWKSYNHGIRSIDLAVPEGEAEVRLSV